MQKHLKLSLLVVLVMLAWHCVALAAPATESKYANMPHRVCTVGLWPNNRFIERVEDRSYSGFDIELWEHVAKTLGIRYEYKMLPSFYDMLSAVSNGKTDIGLGTITMTQERMQSMTFTYPYLITRLGILVDAKDPAGGLANIARAITTPAMKHTAEIMLLVVLVFGHILWFFERGQNPLISKKYLPGVFEAMWCAFAIQSTIGDVTPKRWVGRILSAPIWVCGLLLASLITAQLLNALVIQKNRSGINNHRDLHGRIVATLDGTTAVQTLERLGVRKIVTVKSNLVAAFPMLESGKVDAIVFDYPGLIDIADTLRKQGKQPLIVEERFNCQMYAFALNKQFDREYPDLAQRMNNVILELSENGYIQHLWDKWFNDANER